jgi:hypothetical protein
MESFNLTIVILIFLLFLFSDEVFFDLLYNNKIGRFVIVLLLIAISIVSIWLSFIFLMIIMYFSQLNKSKSPIQENFDKMDRVNVSDVLNNNFLYKNYKSDNLYKKSKKIGLNVVRESEKVRPKSSKSFPLTSNKPSKNITPYSKNIYYNI